MYVRFYELKREVKTLLYHKKSSLINGEIVKIAY